MNESRFHFDSAPEFDDDTFAEFRDVIAAEKGAMRAERAPSFGVFRMKRWAFASSFVVVLGSLVGGLPG